jgi:N-acetylglucosaminyldiphosphoundecaprenol N-acetyl-beta-D-mannosaminyltransferase
LRIKFLKYNLDDLTLEETVDRVVELINSGNTQQHVVLNASKIVLMERNKELAEIINSCAIINADGMSIVWASKILGHKLKGRVTGIDLMQNLLEVADKKGYRIFLLGGEEEVVKIAVNKIQGKYKNLTVAGYRNGYFKKSEELKIVKQINDSNCQILFLGFSSPNKEFFLNDYKNLLKVPFCMGVGGSFDIIAEKYKRAPKRIQKVGLEWFYRYLQEPRRLWKRYTINNLLFVMLVFRYKFFKKQ